jgi:hypothetical protein
MSIRALISSLHPKVQASALAGAVVTIIVALASAFGHPLNADSTAALTTIAAVVAGWLKPAGAAPQDDMEPADA